MKYPTVTEENLLSHCTELAGREEFFAQILANFGLPSLWKRSEGFATLIRIILEQQVSLASARAAHEKFFELYGELSPEKLLRLSDAELKAAYFSRQKIGYSRELALAVAGGDLVFEKLRELSDDEVRERLTTIKGIGRWTADIYLLMALSRPDVMPVGDIALYAAFQKLRGLERRPLREEFALTAEKWSPHRSAAARLLWHFYLSSKKIAKQTTG